MKLYQFRCGSGDHCLIHFTKTNEYGIVDFHFQSNLQQTEPVAVSYFRQLLREHPSEEIVIAFLAISHYDTDHIKGMDAFIDLVELYPDRIHINNIWLAGDKDLDNLFKLFKEKINNYKRKVITKDESKFIQDYEHLIKEYDNRLDKLEIFVADWEENTGFKSEHINHIRSITANKMKNIGVKSFAPLEEHIKDYQNKTFDAFAKTLLKRKKIKSDADRNLISSIFFIENEPFKLCFGGDADKKVWLDALAKNESFLPKEQYSIASDFVKVSHHGSKNSSDPTIWSALIKDKAEVYFGISAGNKHEHPHEETLAEIEACCKVCGSLPKIVSTNNSDNCCQLEALEAEDIRSFNIPIGEIAIAGTENAAVMEEDEIRRKPKRTKGENLLAYIFEFDFGTQKVTARKGLSKYAPAKYKKCFFKNQCPMPD